MTVLIPTHLAGRVRVLPSADARTRSFALVSAAGGERFSVSFVGDILADPGVVSGTWEQPLLVVATAVDSGERIVVFDAGRHGYDAMFAEVYEDAVLDGRGPENRFRIPGGVEGFGVRIDVFDNIDWDEEEDDLRDSYGVIRLVSGEAIDGERLRRDGYDAIAVRVEDEAGAQYVLVDEELA